MERYTPESPPLSIQPELAEWLQRELLRISSTFIGVEDDGSLYQPHDTDLDAISALATQTYGRSFITFANEAAFKAGVNLEIGTDVQAWSAILDGTTASFTAAKDTKLSGIATGADVTATAVNATAKATPVDADRVSGSDSAASFGLIYNTWTQIKAFLKTYFDTLYVIPEEGTYTPTITATVGTFTSITSITGGYTKLGRLVVFRFKFTITTVGTAANYILVSLPFTANATGDFSISGSEWTITGKMIQGVISSSGTIVHLRFYDNTSPIAAGNVIQGSGSYWV